MSDGNGGIDPPEAESGKIESGGPEPGRIESGGPEPIDIETTIVEPGLGELWPGEPAQEHRARVTMTSSARMRVRRVGPDGQEIWVSEVDGRPAKRFLLGCFLVGALLTCSAVYLVFYLLSR